MRSLGSKIRAQRRRLGLSLQQLADRADCAKSYLSAIENDQRPHNAPPSEDLLRRLERALDLPRGDLLTLGRWHKTPPQIRREMDAIRQSERAGRRLATLVQGMGLDAMHRSGELEKLVAQLSGTDGDAPGAGRGDRPQPVTLAASIPLINRVAAGYPTEFTDLDYPARIADEYVSAPDVHDPQAFAARVVGDSMTPDYVEGDIVVFSPERDTPSGSDCFIRLERDDETTFKRVFLERDDRGSEVIRLQPLNRAYPARILPREDIAGMYAAVYVIRQVSSPTWSG